MPHMLILQKTNRRSGTAFSIRRLPSVLGWLLLLVAVVGWLSADQAVAQTEVPEDLVITISQFDTSKYPEITLYVNVKDGTGKHVTNLTRSDFSVSEDDKAVEMVDFAGEGQARLVDIVYVFDTTGSMSEEIKGVIRTSLAFADQLVSKGRDYRLGLVTFSDQVLQVYRQDDALSDQAEEFKGWVSGLKAEGGDGDPENAYGAIKRAAQMKYRDGAQKIIILITDAPPHKYGDADDGGQRFDDPDLSSTRILDLLKGKGISVYAVTPAYTEFTTLAADSGGQFYDLKVNPDFTSMIEEIGETLANQYRITYRSPRPTYDGTRRDVTVKVGEKAATKEYSEKHLLTIQSNCLVGLLCLTPLLGALVIPLAGKAALKYLQARSAGEVPPAAAPPSLVRPEEMSPPQACPKCGNLLRSGAKFCNACGHKLN